MPKEATRAVAKVRITVEVSITRPFGNCALEDVYKKATEEAKNILSQNITSSMKDIRMIGKPEVDAIVFTE